MIGPFAALAAASVVAQASYPAGADRDSIAAWLPQATGLTPQQVVAVTSSAVIALVERGAVRDGHATLLLRALPLSPEAAERSGMLAWQMSLEADCATGAVRLGATTGYQSRLAAGDGVALSPAEADWRQPRPGTPLESAWRAACQSRPAAPAAVAYARNATTQAPVRLPSAKPVVQVVSSPTPANARQALAGLQGRLARRPALQTRIEPAQVRGRTVYRGVIAGFGSRDDARGFCDDLRRDGQDCLVR